MDLSIHQVRRELDRLVTRAIVEERRKLREHLNKEPRRTVASPHWRAVRTRQVTRIAHLLKVRAGLSEMVDALFVPY